MDTQDARASAKLVRTSVLIPPDVHEGLQQLAGAGERPLSWEIRRALEEHVERQLGKAAA